MEKNPLFSPVYLRKLLNDDGLVPHKSRGQNFLIDRNVSDKIIRAANLTRDDAVLEIGPGPGGMTRELCSRAGKVVAVEWDRGLAGILRGQTDDCDNLEIIEADFLQVDLTDLSKLFREGSRRYLNIKVVANLPYSITGPLLVKLLESDINFSLFILMVQKEVGKRIISSPGCKAYGRLAVLCRTYSNPEIVSPVSRNSFYPSPRVDSSIVRFRFPPESSHPISDINLWSTLVRAAFARRRKMLKNTLASDQQLGYSEDQIIGALIQAKINPKDRAEQLSTDDFIRLSNSLFLLRQNKIS